MNVILCLWCLYYDPVINNDAVTYLSAASVILQGDFSAAFSYYHWPFYSFFIAAIAWLLPIDVETAAHVSNIIFVVSLSIAFLAIVNKLSHADKIALTIAFLVILFFPSISKYRSYIIRDFAYLSCYLWSLYYIFCFLRAENKKNLILCFFWITSSVFFRIEGVLFLLLTLCFLIGSIASRKKYLFFFLATFLTLGLLFIAWYLNQKYASMITVAQIQGQSLFTLKDLFLHNVLTHFQTESINFIQMLQFVFSRVINVFYEITRRLAIVYLLFALYALYRIKIFDNIAQSRIYYLLIGLNLILLAGFSLFNDFLVSRYTMPTVLLLLVASIFSITTFVRRFSTVTLRSKCAGIFFLLLMSGLSIDKLSKTSDKRYLIEAGQWLRDNAPKDALLYSNTKLIMYYADVDLRTIMLTPYNTQTIIKRLNARSLHEYEYIALFMDKKNINHNASRQTLSYQYGEPVKIIAGTTYESVYIFHYKRKVLCHDPDRKAQ